eukprot:CAMPEP_0172540110 /NCGR_PEP_ID=MMETSP1067-20121228/11181_1 /TAXON_ID=265564 ORGANISM="Thalassiosira punctigera, Strain Tpunct2005C2" /NCGR_SAMPLE_ID=MMETSP1067 /ASSEMBLY_ACC=CAM_ASM_000444 /LENGTH=234 /DNA_ID=CAMNT_0013325895 /DNA_START=21 /DNA_END=722 /DNA_ORIENTATION=-
MNVLWTLSLLLICAVNGFKSSVPHRIDHHCSDRHVSRHRAIRRDNSYPGEYRKPSPSRAACQSSKRSPSSLRNSASEFDVSEDEAEATILRINFSYPSSPSDDGKGGVALAAVQKYTQSFPFVAVLPVQPLTYLPVKRSDGNPAVKVTFLRKKTAEKGSMDGGMLFSSCLVSEEDCDEDGSDNYKKGIQLTAQRITKGQTVSKVFSEKQIILAFVKGLTEQRGKDILMEGGDVE